MSESWLRQRARYARELDASEIRQRSGCVRDLDVSRNGGIDIVAGVATDDDNKDVVIVRQTQRLTIVNQRNKHLYINK